MELFFDTEFNQKNPVLNKEESHHCLKVKRHKPGDHIGIMDGKGSIFKGVIAAGSSSNNCIVEDVSLLYYPSKNPEIHIGVAILKNSDRFEWMVEKATELGVGSITPLFTNRIERKKINWDRLLKKAISAVKQSNNPWLPNIHQPLSFQNFIENNIEGEQKLIAHLFDDNKNQISIGSLPKTDSYTVLIGPEGGFIEAEVQLALNSGYKGFSLADNILRTETAVIAAVAQLIALG